MRSTNLMLIGWLAACSSSPEDMDAGTASAMDAGPLEAGGGDAANDSGGDEPCLVADDGASTGSGLYAVESMELAPGRDGASVYYPAGIAESGCAFAVIGWGNGTSSMGGDAYPAYFERLASHGFVVAVAHTNFAAAGPVILDTAALVLALNDDPESPFFGKLRRAYGVMGKSQGAIAAARDVNLDPDAVAAVMVAGSMGTVTRPALFATGTTDFLQGQTLGGYEAATEAAVYAEATDVDHLGLDESVPVAQLATSFMRCHLQGDAGACAYLACEECRVEAWSAYQVK
ncbi:MAG: hypothetical protein AAF447_20895 [Myxococcota bacterium]